MQEQKKPRPQMRDPVTKQYAFDGDMTRLCKCGHTLGVHIAGGFECGTTADKTHPAYGCTCQKFQLVHGWNR